MPTPRDAEKQRRPADPASDEQRQRRRKASRTRSVPGTGSFSVNDGPVKRQHIRRKYEPDERQQVAERRRLGACTACKLSKTKCTHDPPPNATAKFQHEAQSHELFSLGLTTTSEIVSLNKHKHVMGQVIAAIDNKLEGRDAQNQVIGMQQPVGQPPDIASQRIRRDEANKSEYRPLRKKPECATTQKLSTTVHNGPGPPASKPGLQPGVIQTWRLDRPTKGLDRPTKGNRPLRPKPEPLRHRKVEDQTCQPYVVATTHPGGMQQFLQHMQNRGAKAPPYHVGQVSQRLAPIIVPHVPPSYLEWQHQEPSFHPYQVQVGPVQWSEESNASENSHFPPQAESRYGPPVVEQQLQGGPAIGKKPSLPLSVAEVDDRLNEIGVFYPGMRYDGSLTEWDQSTAVTENLDMGYLSFQGSISVTSGLELAEGGDDWGDDD